MSLLTKRTCFRGNKWGDKGGQTKAPPTGIAGTLNQRGAEKGIQISPPLKEGSTQIQENTMARDKSYGSGKSRTAANSNARARVAAKRFTKGPKSPIDNLVSRNKAASPSMARDKYSKKTVRSLQKGAANALEFATGVRVGRKGVKSVDPLALGMAFLPLGKATRVAQTLLNANKATKAAALLARSATSEAGRAASRQWAATRAMAGSGKKFQASASKSWEMRFLGENLKAAANAVPKKASLAVAPTIGKKLAKANRANAVVRELENRFGTALKYAKNNPGQGVRSLEETASTLSRVRRQGVPIKRGR
jgi:hypothetical protein